MTAGTELATMARYDRETCAMLKIALLPQPRGHRLGDVTRYKANQAGGGVPYPSAWVMFTEASTIHTALPVFTETFILTCIWCVVYGWANNHTDISNQPCT